MSVILYVHRVSLQKNKLAFADHRDKLFPTNSYCGSVKEFNFTSFSLQKSILAWIFSLKSLFIDLKCWEESTVSPLTKQALSIGCKASSLDFVQMRQPCVFQCLIQCHNPEISRSSACWQHFSCLKSFQPSSNLYWVYWGFYFTVGSPAVLPMTDGMHQSPCEHDGLCIVHQGHPVCLWTDSGNTVNYVLVIYPRSSHDSYL